MESIRDKILKLAMAKKPMSDKAHLEKELIHKVKFGDEYDSEFAEIQLIKKYRNVMKVSQDRLSKMADVTYNTLIKIESGANTNPTIDTLAKIAKALNVSVDELLK